ncbi:hypothetical protein OG474_24500 [Kribbella sp. NBC_01505]|uniref:hypothetical protein n=1 Tax=Kribbella sp. NBC_01505 TaxID=2903580 RepID=UPI0038701162
MTLPRLDPYMQGIGEEVEDLSRISASQPYESLGPVLPRQALNILVERSRKVTIGLKELLEAGLATDKGKLTEQGQLVKTILTKPAAQIRIESSRGRATLTFEAYIANGQAVLLASASPASLPEVPHGEDILTASAFVRLDFVPAGYVPIAIASWVGIAPAWSLATNPEQIEQDLLIQRADDDAIPPPADADAHLKYVWSQPWFLWTLAGSNLNSGLVMISAGRAGHFALARGEGTKARFMSYPSMLLWRKLVALVEQSLTA